MKITQEPASAVSRRTFLKTTTGKQPEVLYPILPPPTPATLKPSLQ